MGRRHQVEQGESVESIAFAAGLLSKTIWDDPENANLKKARKSLHVLLPGDVLHVPDIRIKTVKCATDREHVFKRKEVPSKVRVRFLVDGQPMAAKAYTFRVDGDVHAKRGTTDGDGWLEEEVSPAAKSAVVELEDTPLPDKPQTRHVYNLQLRCLDPSSEITGMQGRLRNLGYWPGEIDGVLGPRTVAALKSFQKDNNLGSSGALDSATKSKLAEFAGG